jgi:hypothetical protein
MTRSTIAAAFAISLVLISSFNFPTALASVNQLDIMSVIFPSQVPYDQPIPVRVMVSYSGNSTPSVSLYYWISSNSTSIGSGWRITSATPVAVVPEQDVAVYSAALPNAVFGDVLSYGMTVVFWVEAVLGPTTNSTAQGSDRWNPNVLQGKFLVQMVDPYPPTIKSVSLTPQQPTSSDDVIVQVNFAKSPLGANMSQAQLEYSVNGTLPGTTLNMTQSYGLFQATIPAQAAGSKVSYRITGGDEAGNSVQSNWASYVVNPSQADLQKAQQEQAAQTRFLEMVVGLVAAVAAVILAIVLYRQRTRVRSRVKSLTTTLPSTYNAFTISVFLSIAVVGWTAYSITQFGHTWLALVSLVVVVEFWGLADPKLGTLFGLFRAPTSGVRAAVFEAFRTPGAPLLVSAYTLVLVGTAAAILLNLGGFIDRQGLLAIMHFFASYALILVGLGALVRYLAYAFPAKTQLSRAAESS